MRKKGFKATLFVILIFQALFVTGQQDSIQVIVMDDKGTAIPYFRISINGDDKYVSDKEGQFTCKLSDGEKPNEIIAVQEGYAVSSWSLQGQNKIEIMVKRSTIKLIKGKLLLADGKPAVNTDIQFKDIKPSLLTTTDSTGRFQFVVPVSTHIDRNSLFHINDFEIFDQKLEFIGIYRFTIRISPIPTHKLPGKLYEGVVTDTENNPITNQRVAVGQIDYITNELGIFKAIVIDPNAAYKVDGYKIKNILPSKSGDLVSIKVFKKQEEVAEHLPLDSEQPIVLRQTPSLDLRSHITDSSEITQDIKNIVTTLGEDNKSLIEKNDQINETLERVTEKINADPGVLTQEHRDTLEQQLAELENLMQEYDLIDQQYLKTRKTVDELRRNLLENEDKMLLIQQERDKETAKLRKQFMIAAGTSLLISLIALTLLFLAYRFKKQKQKIGEMKADLEVTYVELADTHNKLEKENEHRKDSIRYAQTIQNAILPPKKNLDNFLQDHFILFRPKDIVSGDFYWFANGIEENNHKTAYIAVADCTGHGVPGAFMSMIGSTVLNEIISKNQASETHEILEILDRQIIEALQQEEHKNDDGMDVCLCKLEKMDSSVTRVTFTGAKRPLYYVKHRTQSLEYSKGDNKSIGGILGKKRSFTSNSFFLEKGDILYLTTDGMADQHGPDNRKMGKQRFAELVQENASNTMLEQHQKLEKALDEHQQNQEQRDDITVIGLMI